MTRPRVGGTEVAVANGNVTLGSGFAERLDDSDADGLANALVVSPTITAQVAGEYLVNARLIDAAGEQITLTSGLVTVAAGSHPLDLTFDGAQIFAARRDGPYRVVDLHVLNESDSVLQLDVPDLGATQMYTFNRFQH